MNLTAFDTRFHSTCCSRSGSAGIDGDVRIEVGLEPQRLGVGGRRDGFERRPHQAGEVDALDVEPHLARDDARDVEHVLDDLGERHRVALDGCQRLRLPLQLDRALAQHAGVAEDRVQRRAQLVRQAGEELVLQPAGFLHRDVEPRVLERHRGP